MNQFDNIIIFTDGACSNNGKPTASGGCGVYFPNKEFQDVSQPFTKSPITNNRAELYAILSALNKLENIKYNTVTINSDSKYAINCVTIWYKKWEKNGFVGSNKKPVENLDIIDEIVTVIRSNPNITFEYVERKYNTEADKLAKNGCK
jgi:ribonuclease HI